MNPENQRQADFFCGKLNGITFPYSSGGIHFVAFFVKLLGTKNSMIFVINHPTCMNKPSSSFSMTWSVTTSSIWQTRCRARRHERVPGVNKGRDFKSRISLSSLSRCQTRFRAQSRRRQTWCHAAASSPCLALNLRTDITAGVVSTGCCQVVQEGCAGHSIRRRLPRKDCLNLLSPFRRRSRDPGQSCKNVRRVTRWQ